MQKRLRDDNTHCCLRRDRPVRHTTALIPSALVATREIVTFTFTKLDGLQGRDLFRLQHH
jgi:hypothetical protein